MSARNTAAASALHGPARRRPIKLLAAYGLILALISLAVQKASGGFGADLGNHADEAAHFVSSLTIKAYLAHGIGTSPLGFAKDYYLHFPKVAIGHWPPVFESLQAFVFLIFGGTERHALLLQAVIGGLYAALPATVIGGWLGLGEGLLAGLIVLFSPIVLPMLNMVMADTLLGALVTLTAISWSRFYQRRSWGAALLFALIAACSILTKGSALGLALLPVVYLLIRRDMQFLFDRKTLAAAGLTGLLCLPWYAVTYTMAADGFVFHFGLAYTSLAMPFFLETLPFAIGWFCLAGCLGGIVLLPRHSTAPAPDIAAFAATAIAMTGFAMVAPADLDPRYLIPALPSLTITGIWGLTEIAARAMPHRVLLRRAGIGLGLAATALVLFTLPQPQAYHADRLIEDVVGSDKPNRLVLVSGSVPAEGAVVAGFAARNALPGGTYIIRAQKALARTNWMATTYEPRFTDAADLARWIDICAIGWIVIDRDTAQPDFPHNRLLQQALDQGSLHATRIETVTHKSGTLTLYALPAADKPAMMSDQLYAAGLPGHLGGLLQ